MAVRMLIVIWMIVFQVSFFIFSLFLVVNSVFTLIRISRFCLIRISRSPRICFTDYFFFMIADFADFTDGLAPYKFRLSSADETIRERNP